MKSKERIIAIHMKKIGLSLMVASLFFTGCSGGDDTDSTPVEDSGSEASSPTIDENAE